jgi:hypothetical protein
MDSEHLQQKFDEIKERRRAEALSKSLNQKLLTIVRVKGYQITDFISLPDPTNMHGDLNWSSNENPYKYQEYEEELIPIRDDMEYSQLLGYCFDALSYGCNLQIVYLDLDKELKVTYEGVVVFEEVEGDLKKYLPNPVWEDKIEHWAKGCSPALEILQKKQQETEKKEQTLLLEKVFDYLKNTWGI